MADDTGMATRGPARGSLRPRSRRSRPSRVVVGGTLVSVLAAAAVTEELARRGLSGALLPGGTVLVLGLGVLAVAADRGRTRAREAAAEAAASLRASELLFRRGFENSPIGMSLMDADGNWTLVNDSLARLLGYRPEQLVGMNFVAVTHPEDAPIDNEAMSRLRDGEIDEHLQDKRYFRQDGTTVWVVVSVTPLRDDAGTVVQFLTQVLDVTVRRESEQAAREAMLREQEALRVLRELDAMKSELLAAVSHDLRTPLTAVIGFARLLQGKWDRLADPTRRDLVSRIVDNGVELDRRVGEFLDLSRVERGELKLAPRDCNLADVVSGALNRCAYLLRQHSVELHVSPRLLVRGDPGALGRIVENLVVNASQYSPPDSRVTIDAEPTPDGLVAVTVRDEGLGLSEEEASRVFDRYYRARRDRSSPRGIGMGLASVKQLVELSGGTVWVVSHPGEGSYFGFSVPAARTSPERLGSEHRDRAQFGPEHE